MKQHITSNRSYLAALSLLAASLAVGCVTTDPAAPDELAADDQVGVTTQSLLGSDACKDVDITVTNSRTRDFEDTILMVHRVEYHSASEGRWYTEQLDDKLLFFGDSFTWWNQNLQYAENDLLTEWKVYYEFFQDGEWSSLVHQLFNTTDHICHADDNFSFTVQ